MSGKGDKPRTKNTKQYRENFDAIDWNDKYPFKMKKGVIQAPNWLKKRMRELRAMPPPSIEQIKIQMEASANYNPTMDAIKKMNPMR